MALRPQTVVFFHPDLGIGGAERLVIDAAVGLQKRGHKVVIFTSHCDPLHCFEEARNGILDVRVRGNSVIPRAVLRRLTILCAILRQLHLILQIGLFSSELADLQPNILFVDQLSAGVPLLRYISSTARILFYCHFPDKLLVTSRSSLLNRLYRLPFDRIESWSTGCADSIVVNSAFTQSIFSEAFPSLRHRKPGVVHPCVSDTDILPSSTTQVSDEKDEQRPMWGGKRIILSINRFERKKGLNLALRAFAAVKSSLRKSARLVIAGGYDTRVPENVSHHAELSSLASELGLKHATSKTVIAALAIPSDVDVLFLLSVPGAFKSTLLKQASLLVYTPRGEHFGIVPLEAMREGVPVLAANEGGPTETVIDGMTGWLKDAQEVDEWTGVMESVLEREEDDEELSSMGSRGRQRAEEFSAGKMVRRLEDVMGEMLRGRRQKMDVMGLVVFGVGVVGGLVAMTAAVLLSARMT